MALNGRKVYLDSLRGLAVAIMVEAHVVDAWTREVDRHDTPYFWAVFVAGMAAPLFLFLAGVTLAIAANARASAVGTAAAAAIARFRGWQIFALAFLFRIQSQLLGWGAWGNLLKVDILNVMGLAMVVAGGLWGLSCRRTTRLALFAVATGLMTMMTPPVREAAWLASLPDAIEAYIRPMPGRTTFAIFPWAGFLFAGMIVGDLVSAARTIGDERRLQAGLAVAGFGGIALAYAASFRPSIYPIAHFWTSSPTFFFIRLGIATALVPTAWLVGLLPRVADWFRSSISAPPVVVTLGRSSLFVYWIHVEMVYGFLGRPFRRALPLEASLTATVVLGLLLYGIVLWKNRAMKGVELRGPARLFAPVLK